MATTFDFSSFSASDVGQKAISAVAGKLVGLVGGLFKGHSDWYYMRQHLYGWNINSSGDKSVEFGSDVWEMFRTDLKNNIALAVQNKENDMDAFAGNGMWYTIAKAALPYKSQYFNIAGDDTLIQIACDLLAAGMLPTDNKVLTSPDLGGEYNKSWQKYNIDNVAAIAQLRQTDYYKKTYGSTSGTSTLSGVSTTVNSVADSLTSSLLQPKTDASGNVVTDSTGVVQYEYKRSAWVVVCIIAACIVCLGFVVSLFGKKKRK
ncbi:MULTISPECIES: hypothetical protein [Chitinophagaceae]